MREHPEQKECFIPLGVQIHQRLIEQLGIPKGRALRSGLNFEEPGLVSVRVDFLIYENELQQAIQSVSSQEKPQ